MKGTEDCRPMGSAFPQGRAGKEGHLSVTAARDALAERSRHHHTDQQWSGVPLRLRMSAKLGSKESKIHPCHGGHQQMDRRVLGQSRLQLVQRIMNLRILAVVILLGLTAGTAFGAPRPVVVELFTSQGCSDCPPADALLRHIKATDPGILPLDLHVTYWDNAAWTDPFSLQPATDLQSHYASLRGSMEVYTPEAVVDGRAQFVGSDQATMAAAIAQSRAAIARDGATPVSVSTSNGRVSVLVGSGTGVATVWLFGINPERTTKVQGGENGGTTLTEVNVVRSITRLGSWNGQPLERSISVPAGTKFAALVQRSDGTILGAAEN
jgi:hypothetical protein